MQKSQSFVDCICNFLVQNKARGEANRNWQVRPRWRAAVPSAQLVVRHVIPSHLPKPSAPDIVVSVCRAYLPPRLPVLIPALDSGQARLAYISHSFSVDDSQQVRGPLIRHISFAPALPHRSYYSLALPPHLRSSLCSRFLFLPLFLYFFFLTSSKLNNIFIPWWLASTLLSSLFSAAVTVRLPSIVADHATGLQLLQVNSAFVFFFFFFFLSSSFISVHRISARIFFLVAPVAVRRAAVLSFSVIVTVLFVPFHSSAVSA